MKNSSLQNSTAQISLDTIWAYVPFEHKIALWFIDTLGSVLGIGGNLFVLVIFVRTKRLQTKTNTLLMSLIVSGLLMSLTLQPIRADQENPFFTVGLPYNVANAISITSYFACIYSVFCVTLERFIAVLKPLQHVTLVTSQRIKGALITVWLLSIIAGATLYELKHRPIFDGLAISNFTLVTVTSVVMYAYIFHVVHQQRKFIRRQSTPLQNTRKKKPPTDNSTTLSAIFFSIFIVLWLPTFVYLYFLDFALSESQTDVNIYIIGQYLISIHLWNGSINWYVYCWKCDKFRIALFECRGKRPDYDLTFTNTANGIPLRKLRTVENETRRH